MGTVNNIQAPVIDQSHGHIYIVQDGGTINKHYGAMVYQDALGTSAKSTVPRPHRRCPAPSVYYTERQSIEEHMAAYFFGTRRGPKRYVLHGLGGAGKTEVAKAFVYRHHYDIAESEERRFSDVFWVDATSAQTITESLEDIAQAEGINVQDVLTWFANRDGVDRNWIILFNNAENVELNLPKYFPDCSHGNILITTRSREARRYGAGPGSDHAVGSMTEAESQQLLTRHLHLDNPSGPSVTYDVAYLAQELGHFPLSLGQAGAFITNTHLTPNKYLKMLQTQREQFLAKQGQLNHPDKYEYTTTHAAWLISFEGLSPQAKQLLWFCAFLHYDDIRQSIFENMCTGLRYYKDQYPRLFTEAERAAIARLEEFREGLLVDGSWSELRFLELISELQSRSLVSFIPEQATWSFHPLVHQWARDTLDEGEQISTRNQVFILLGSARSRTTKEWAFDALLAPHVDEVLRGAVLEFEGCRNEFAAIYRSARRWDDELGFRAGYRESCERMLDEDDDLTLASITELATTYRYQKRFNDAVKLELLVIQARKKKLGGDHLDTFESINNLAITFLFQGRLDDAAKLELQVMEARKSKLGEDHLDTLESMSNLAAIYWKQKRLDAAAGLQLQVMEVLKKKLGEDHLDTLQAMSNLASAYWAQGRLDAAVGLQLQVLEARKRKLGEDHLDTLQSMFSLALTYWKQGRLDDVARLQVHVMEVLKRKLGCDHLDTLNSMASLTVTYWRQGRFDDAAGLQVQVMEGRKKRQGEDHLDTLESMATLSHIYYLQDRLEDAAVLASHVLEHRMKILGPDHPDTKQAVRRVQVIRLSTILTAWYRIPLRKIKSWLNRAS